MYIHIKSPMNLHCIVLLILHQVYHQNFHLYILQKSQLKNPDQLLHQNQYWVYLKLHLKIPVHFHLLITENFHQENHQDCHIYILQKLYILSQKYFFKWSNRSAIFESFWNMTQWSNSGPSSILGWELLHQNQYWVYLKLHLKIPVHFHLLITENFHQENHQDCHIYILQKLYILSQKYFFKWSNRSAIFESFWNMTQWSNSGPSSILGWDTV